MNTIIDTRTTSKFSGKCDHCSFSQFCHSSKLSYPVTKHQSVCKAQQPFKIFYVVKSGVLKSSILDRKGKERIVRFYLPGETLGLEAIHNNNHPFTVKALNDTVVCEISYENVLSMMSSHPTLQIHLLEICSQQLNNGNYITLALAEQRVAGFLLELAERLHCKDNNLEFNLPMSRQAIGDYLGLAAETIMRIITRFHQQGILFAHKKKIKIFNPHQLHWIMRGGLIENFS